MLYKFYKSGGTFLINNLINTKKFYVKYLDYSKTGGNLAKRESIKGVPYDDFFEFTKFINEMEVELLYSTKHIYNYDDIENVTFLTIHPFDTNSEDAIIKNIIMLCLYDAIYTLYMNKNEYNINLNKDILSWKSKFDYYFENIQYLKQITNLHVFSTKDVNYIKTYEKIFNLFDLNINNFQITDNPVFRNDVLLILEDCLFDSRKNRFKEKMTLLKLKKMKEKLNTLNKMFHENDLNISINLNNFKEIKNICFSDESLRDKIKKNVDIEEIQNKLNIMFFDE